MSNPIGDLAGGLFSRVEGVGFATGTTIALLATAAFVVMSFLGDRA